MKKISSLLKQDWYILLMLAASFLFSAFCYPHLPMRVPIHWDSAGNVNGYASRGFGAFFSPFTALGVYLLLCVIPAIDPRAGNYEKFKGSYQMIKCLTVILFLVIQICTLLAGVGVKLDINIIVGVSVSVLFILMGNVMGRFRLNYFVGIRTPWALANEEVFRKTNRFAAPVWVIGGLVNLAITLFASRFAMNGMLITVAGMVVLPYVYSYLLYRHIGKK